MAHTKRLLIILLALLLQNGLQAQTDSAYAILNRATYWKTAKTYKIDFLFAPETPGSEAVKQRGTLHVKGDRYYITLPDRQIFGDKRHETTVEQGGKTIVLKAKEVSPVLPQQALRLRFLPRCTIPADGYDPAKRNIRMVPVKPRADYTVINIHLQPNNKGVQAIRFEAANGVRYHCFILKVETDINLPDELFEP